MASPLHIILADDEDLIAITLADVLESEGFRVTITHNGRQALDADLADPADVLVTDMRMPVMDGAELIRSIRRRRPDIPVVAITGYSESIPQPEKNRLVVLLKPFNLDILLDTVHSLGASIRPIAEPA